MQLSPPLTPISKTSTQTITKAVEALLKWKSTQSTSQKLQLLPSDEFLYLVLTLNKIPSKSRTNAHKIPLPNPLYFPDASEFCLFVHESMSKPAKQKVEEGQVPVSKVIKLSKLKSDYKAFEQKRKLCDSYDMFFADKRIIPLLPNAIGKNFYKKKKIPVPIELGRANWKEQIERACSSAMLYLSTGTCSVIKVAKGSMSKEEIVENVVAAVNGIAEIVPKKWGNVRAFHLKFSESLALPVYQKVPELGLKIQGMIMLVGNDSEKNMVVAPKEVKKGRDKVVKKKGRIHEVMYMDDAGMIGGDESGSEEDKDGKEEVIESENADVGKERKKGNAVKQVKKGEKVKKGMIGGDESGSEEDDDKKQEVIESKNADVGKKRKKGEAVKQMKKGEKVKKGIIGGDESGSEEDEDEEEVIESENADVGKKRKKGDAVKKVKKGEKVQKGVKGLKEKKEKSSLKKSKKSKVLV